MTIIHQTNEGALLMADNGETAWVSLEQLATLTTL
jgi:hypothetical protein